MISSNDIIKTVRSFRDGCLARHEDDIDTLSATDRRGRLGKIDKGSLLDQAFAHLRDDPVDHIAELLTTPRLLKTVLRRVYNAWERLHGEIDFDDLLVANVLRFGAPEGYDFLLQRFTEIRGLKREGIAHDADKRRKSLNDAWEHITKAVSWDKSGAYALVAFLFPELRGRGYSHKDIPQGVRHAAPTDYWIRFNAEHIEQSVIPDQQVLHAIATWKQNHASVAFRGETLAVELFKNSMLSSKVEQFGSIFLRGEDVQALASALFEVMISRLDVKANRDSCEAFIALWRVYLDLNVSQEKHSGWISPEILKALPVSLRFANDLYYFWRHKDHNAVSFKGEQRSPEIRTPAIEKAKELFSDSPTRLVEVLDPDFMFSIFHFAVLYSSSAEGGDGFRPEDWRWLADALVKAGQQNSRRALPQTIPFLVSSDMGVDGYIHKFNQDLATGFFGQNLRTVMGLLANGFDIAGFDAADKSRILFIRDFAAKWLKGQT